MSFDLYCVLQGQYACYFCPFSLKIRYLLWFDPSGGDVSTLQRDCKCCSGSCLGRFRTVFNIEQREGVAETSPRSSINQISISFCWCIKPLCGPFFSLFVDKAVILYKLKPVLLIKEPFLCIESEQTAVSSWKEHSTPSRLLETFTLVSLPQFSRPRKPSPEVSNTPNNHIHGTVRLVNVRREPILI